MSAVAPPVLEASGVTVLRDGRAVLSGVSLALRPGDRVTLTGRNGSGKSMLIRALAGLEPVSRGAVRRADPTRPIGVVMEQGGLVRGLTVAENLALPLVRGRAASGRIAERVAWALARFDLAPWERATVEQLTRGLSVRVQIARATLLEPNTVLCDGALDTLDPDAATECERLLARFADAGTGAVVIATNVPERTRLFARRVLRLDQGRVVSDTIVADSGASTA